MKSYLYAAILGILSTASFAQVTLNGCTHQPVTIVVLGSSTAAGAGASTGDSAWVNRYRHGLQQINPSNQVINLGVGGYTTYRIMPDNFVTPANRPAVDTLHNLTHALSLNPDAIIVNLPSNDRNWPASEQLANFDSLYRHSWNNGVPIYICTTQPITSSGAYQKGVRDSILSMFGPHAIDVFSPLADSVNLIQPQFAADAVHLNDLGHRTLFQTIWNKDLLKDIVTPTPGIDVAIIESYVISGASCPYNLEYNVHFVNYGDTNTGQITVRSWIVGQDSNTMYLSPGFYPCTDTWAPDFLDTITPGPHQLIIYAEVAGDINLQNNYDTLNVNITGYGHSGFEELNYYCQGDTFHVPSHNSDGDSLVWLDENFQLQSYSSIPLTGTHDFYYKALFPPYTFQQSVNLSSSPNVTWDGNMFNIIADTTLTITELRFISGSAGTSYPLIHTTNGNYRGREASPGLWSLAGADTLSNLNIGDSIIIQVNIPLVKGDTLGVYAHFGNSTHRLRYQSGSSDRFYLSGELTIQTGSGVSHNWGTTYDHRALTGTVEYKWGINEVGRCSTQFKPISFIPDSLTLQLPDTLFASYSGSWVTFGEYTNISWFNTTTSQVASVSNFIWMDASLLDSSISTQYIQMAVEAESPLGCFYADTMIVSFATVNLQEHLHPFEVYPNPTAGDLTIDRLDSHYRYRIIDLSGNQLQTGQLNPDKNRLTIHELPSGVYVLQLMNDASLRCFRIILTD